MVPDDPLRGDPSVRLESQIERWEAAGSYVELDRALARLRAWDELLWRHFMRERVSARGLDEPSGGVWDREPASTAEELLLSWMPSHIRVPADVRTAWANRHEHVLKALEQRSKSRRGPGVHLRNRRDAQIRELYARGDGLSSDVLAERFGISARQVRNIVRD